MRRQQVERSGTQQTGQSDSRWNGIGIHAVAAASIYADHGGQRRPRALCLAPTMREDGDCATD